MQEEEEKEEEEEGVVDTAVYKSRDREEKRTSKCCRDARMTLTW